MGHYASALPLARAGRGTTPVGGGGHSANGVGKKCLRKGGKELEAFITAQGLRKAGGWPSTQAVSPAAGGGFSPAGVGRLGRVWGGQGPPQVGTGWSEPHSPGQGKPPASALAAGHCARDRQVEEEDAAETDRQEPGHGDRLDPAASTQVRGRPWPGAALPPHRGEPSASGEGRLASECPGLLLALSLGTSRAK